MFHDSKMMVRKNALDADGGRTVLLSSLLPPMPGLFGLDRDDRSFGMTKEDGKPEWQMFKNLMSSGIVLAQMMEGIGKSLIFLEALLRTAWQPTQDELQRAIAKSPYAGTTNTNQWLEVDVAFSRRSLYIAAEGKLSMHRKRAKAIMENNLGVIDPAEQARILERAEIVSNRSLYSKLVKHNADFKGGMRFFRQDKKTGHWEPTQYYIELITYIETVQKRADDAQAAVDAMDLGDDERAALTKQIDEERIGIVIVDTFGALWGVRSVDDEGLQAVNQRVNADCDRLRITMPVVAHTNKSENAEVDDHRAAGKGAVEMHSTVEATLYGRLCNDAEIKSLEYKGECLSRDQYLMIRIGKTNLHMIDRNKRILKRIPDGAPVCITRKTGLLGAKIEKSKDGFTRSAMKLQLLSAVRFLEEDHGMTVTAGKIQSMLKSDELAIATNYPALNACTKEASGAGEWKMSTLLAEMMKEGCVKAERAGNGTAYSYIRHPAGD